MYILDILKSNEIKNNIISLNNDDNGQINNTNNNNKLIYLIKQLNLMFWILSILILLAYGCLMPFNYMAVGFFTKNYKISKNLAGTLMGTPFLMGAFFVPLLGVFVDKYGYRAEMVLYKIGGSKGVRLNGAIFEVKTKRTKRDGTLVEKNLGKFISGGIFIERQDGFTISKINY